MGKKWIVYLLFLFSLVLILTTCGGSGGGGGGPFDTTAPSVIITIPVDGATDVATNSLIIAIFDERMDGSTIDATTFTVSRGGSNLTGTVTYDSGTMTATFTPSGSFALAARYTATITTGVRDVAGNALTANYSWSFTSRDGIWGTAELIETDDVGGAYYPQIAMDSSGNAIAVWFQWDGSRDNIWANRCEADTGWGTPELIETDNTGNASNPQVAMDSSGNAIAVWFQGDGTRNNIWANRYVAGTGWGTPELIETDNAGDASNPQGAMDSSGNAIAVWEQYDGTQNSIFANRYAAGTGWGTAELIETDDVGTAYNPQVAMDSDGNAIAVWIQWDGTRYNIWANRYVPGTGWGTAELIETDDAGSAAFPQIVMDSSGNAIAVWYQYDGTENNIWANRYVAGAGWGTAELIETDDAGNAFLPQIAMDSDGNAIAVWYQWDGTWYSIFANRYVVGVGWGTAELIETDNAESAFDPQVAMDSSGNAIGVWIQYDGTEYNIWANRYVAGTGWGTAELIETDDAGSAFDPQVAMDSSGNAIGVWYQWDGTRYNIWANRFN